MKKFAIGFGKFCLGVLSGILCVCLVLAMLVTVLVADVRIVTSKDNLNTLITGYLTGYKMPHRQNVPAGAGVLAGGKMAPVKNFDDAETGFDMGAMADGSFLVDFVYGMLQEQSGGELGVSREEVESFVEESTLDDFLAEKGASLVSDFITGENTTTISTEEIVQQLEQNAALLEQTFGVAVDETVIQQVKTSIEESGVVEKIQENGLEGLLQLSGGSNNTMPDENIGGPVDGAADSGAQMKIPTNLVGVLSALMNGELDFSKMSLPQILNLCRAAISAETMWLCIGVCALIIGLIFLASWDKYYRAMIIVGVPFMIVGVLNLIPVFLFHSIPGLLMSFLGPVNTIYQLLKKIIEMITVLPVILVVAGIALVVVGIVLAVKARRRAEAARVAALNGEALEEAPAEEEKAEEIPAEEALAEEVPAEEAEVAAEEAPAEETV